ncbi:hypothetical protein [Terasakiella sp. SH-1]|uniref:hypothetical protein n=1 Tax=Terasakiella sp. SH-1 TaxID=2560057 RepID=UPI0010737149|nr:hypothetical protein [Terasakiella sp. SH-1]
MSNLIVTNINGEADADRAVGRSRAFCNFTSTTNTIRQSFSVSSMTDEGTGRYYVSVASPFVDSGYVATCACNTNTSANHDNNVTWARAFPYTTNKVRYTSAETHQNNFSDTAAQTAQVTVFGDLA